MKHYYLTKKGGSAVCSHRSQTGEADAGVRGKRFYSGAVQSMKLTDSCLKAHLCKTKTKVHFKVQSFEASQWLLSGHPGSLGCSSCCPFQTPSWNLHVEPMWPWAMHLLGLQGCVLLGKSIWTYQWKPHQVGKRVREAPSQRPWALWLLRKEQAVHCASAGHEPVSHEPERTSILFLFPWDISLCVR